MADKWIMKNECRNLFGGIMYDWKQIMAISTVIAAGGFFMRSMQPAHAYIGPSINTGSNPVVSAAGTSSGQLFTSPADQTILISDIVLTTSGYSSSYHTCVSTISISTSGGTNLGEFRVTADNIPWNDGIEHQPSNIIHSFRGGLPVPPLETASISISGGCSVSYTVSGIYVHP
jgi:hypothetical protein